MQGFESTAKSSVVAEVLQALELPHAIVKSQETISQRHLLHKTLQSCVAALPEGSERSLDQRCEHISTLGVQLQSLLEGRNEKFVLVLDGIDKQREAGPTLYPALARIGEMVRICLDAIE